MSAKRSRASADTKNDVDDDASVTIGMQASYCHIITKNSLSYVVALAIATLESGTPPVICEKLGLDVSQCINELLYHITILQQHNLLKNTGVIDITTHVELRPIPHHARHTLFCILTKQSESMKHRKTLN